jgi:hypothetical protein
MLVDGLNLRSVLSLGPALEDTSSAGKMRDAYPIAIFRLEHVLTLFEHQFFGEALYLLPWALVFRVLFSEVISKRTRLFALEVALLIFTYFEKLYHPVTRRTSAPFTTDVKLPLKQGLRPQGPPGSQVALLKWITLIRGMSTIAALICALNQFDFDLPLDRLSTHPLENFFGLLRRLVHDCNMFHDVLHPVARNCVVQHVCDALGHRQSIRRRINLVGVVSRNELGIEILSENGPEQICRGFLYSLNTLTLIDQAADPAKLSCVIDSFDWLVGLHQGSMTAHIHRGERFVIRSTANSKIMASFLQKRAHERATS